MLEKIQPHDRLMQYTVLPLIPQWLKPNHVTGFRIAITPLVLWLIAIEEYRIGIPLFLFAAFTDAIDGSLARVRNQITDVGKLFDPFADKLLIGSVVLLVVMQHLSVFLGLIILAVELFFLIGGLYWYKKGVIVHSDIWGKTKMFLQVLGVLFLLVALFLDVQSFFSISAGTFYVSIVFAIVSLFRHGI